MSDDQTGHEATVRFGFHIVVLPNTLCFHRLPAAEAYQEVHRDLLGDYARKGVKKIMLAASLRNSYRVWKLSVEKISKRFTHLSKTA